MTVASHPDPVIALMAGTCVATVTYGQRVHLLTETLTGAFEAGAGHAVIVTNGVTPETRNQIDALENIFGTGRLTILHSLENEGSAGGFAKAIAAAYSRLQTRHIWLLDDDNRPHGQALTSIIQSFRAMGSDGKNCFSSFRKDKKTYCKIRQTGRQHTISRNSFFGFGPFGTEKERSAYDGTSPDPTRLTRMDMVAYGGFWFDREWVTSVGKPRKDFFLYFDDYEFTLRITGAGGAIWLCHDSLIDDLEESWKRNRTPGIHPWLSPEDGLSRTYFSIRNRVFLERSRVTNRAIYTIHIALYFFLKIILRYPLCFFHPLQTARRMSLIVQAIRDGWHEDFSQNRYYRGQKFRPGQSRHHNRK